MKDLWCLMDRRGVTLPLEESYTAVWDDVDECNRWWRARQDRAIDNGNEAAYTALLEYTPTPYRKDDE